MAKTVVITGSSRGIGSATAILFAEAGWNVMVCYNDSRESANLLVRSMRSHGYNVDLHKLNVTNRLEADLVMKETAYKYGSIDALVNNAGIAQQKVFNDITEFDWKNMLDVNLTGTFNCTQAALPYLLENKNGTIVNVSSIWGISGGSCEVHYSAAKAGVIGFTKALAKELGPSNIRVNCVAPGVIDTSMNANLSIDDINMLADETPLGRIGNATEVARSILFLCGEGGEFITGQVLSPNGGILI